MNKLRLLITACISLAVFACCPAPEQRTSAMTQGLQGADKDFHDSMAKMHHDMMVTPTGDADKDFVAMMIPHHQGAVDMARTELKYGHDPKLRKLAVRIITAQDQEIEFMKAWQAKHSAAQ